MNQKLLKLTDELKRIQSDYVSAKKSLVVVNNDLSSKEELLKNQQSKYQSMKLELAQREVQLQEIQTELGKYAKMDGKSLDSNNYNTLIEKFLEETNVKRELVQMLQAENRRIDQVFMIEAKSLNNEKSEEDLNPNQEVYVKAIKEVVTIKFVRARRDDKKNPLDEDNFPKSSSITQFRIDKDTTFFDLKSVAASFWKVSRGENDLTDENGAQLPEEAKILEYFRNQSQNIDTILLYLKSKESCRTLTQGMLEVISARDHQIMAKMDGSNFQRIKKVEINGYSEFFKEFPGEQDYIDEDKLQEDKTNIVKRKIGKPTKKRFINDNHCCVALVLFILLITNVATIVAQRDPGQLYRVLTGIGNKFRINSEYASFDQSYKSISTLDDFYTFLEREVANNMFRIPDTLNSNIQYPLMFFHNTMIGPLRLRQLRTKTRNDCRFTDGNSQQNVMCYFIKYDDDTKETSKIGSGSETWRSYQTADQNLIESTVQGYSSDYDGSGYVYDFDTTLITNADAQAAFAALKTEGVFDLATRAVLVSANFYNQGLDNLIEIELGAEFTTSGFLRPFEKRINIYKATRYSDGEYSKGHDAFKLILIILILVLVLYTTFTGENGRRAWNWKYFTTFPAIMNMLIVALTCLSVHENIKLDNYEEDIPALVSGSDFFDGKKYASCYETNFFYDSIIVFLLLIRLVYFLNLAKSFSKIIQTITKAGLLLFTYVITLIPIIFSFAIIGMVLWGSISRDFEILPNAIISVISLCLGHFDPRIMEGADIYLIATFLTIYYFFFIFFLITVFASILIDTYRLVTIEFNAQQNEKQEELGFFAWMFSWFPTALYQRALNWILSLRKKKSETP